MNISSDKPNFRGTFAGATAPEPGYKQLQSQDVQLGKIREALSGRLGSWEPEGHHRKRTLTIAWLQSGGPL